MLSWHIVSRDLIQDRTMKQLLLVGILAAVVVAVAGVCPVDPPGIAYGCAIRPQCYGDASCGAGHKCCPHTCGDRCYQIVHCDPIDCGDTKCQYGFKPDAKGCKSCTCRTSAPCSGILCLLHGGTIG